MMAEREHDAGAAAQKPSARQRLVCTAWPLAAALAVLVSDQITKLWALRVLSRGDITLIPNFLYFDLAFNTGAAFSMFSGFPQALTALAAVLAVVIVAWIWSVAHEQRLMAMALGLVLGGALGNLIDRILYAKVTDFIRVHFAIIDWSWPTFNVADSAICIGMGVLLFLTFFAETRERRKRAERENHE